MAGDANVRNVSIQANRLGLCWRLPLGGPKEDADMRRADLGDARRDGLGFHRVINGAKNNSITGGMNDDAAAGEIGDDFVFLSGGRPRQGQRAQKQEWKTHQFMFPGSRRSRTGKLAYSVAGRDAEDGRVLRMNGIG